MSEIGRILVTFGIALIVIGALFIIGSKLGWGLLPGDIFIRKKNFTFIFPLATSILLSFGITLILYLLRYFRK